MKLKEYHQKGMAAADADKFEKAIEWYKKTIELNYIDYMAHWFLADAYKKENKLKKALDEITIAMILNRNNPRIKLSFDAIYELNKLKSPDWTFTPQIQIDSTGEDQVKVAYGKDWLGYALVKALWSYEPGYKESMGADENSFSIYEELEAFASLMTSFTKKKLKKNPQFSALQRSIDKEMVNEFIYYEILLPEYPFVANQFPKETIESIKDYIIEIRGKK